MVGANFAFLKSRVEFSVTYTDKTNRDFPNNLNTSLATGQSTLYTNLGEVEFKGVDVTFNVKPLWGKNFKWDINATMPTLSLIK